MNRHSKGFMKIVYILEMSLAVFILISVAANGIYLIKHFPQLIYVDSFKASYELLEQLFAHILLLVIGLELAMMLVNHTTSAVIEVMLYAVARKMLIYTNNTYEMLIGVVALAGIFAIHKYLYCAEIGKEKKDPDDMLNSNEPIKPLNNLPERNDFEEFKESISQEKNKVKSEEHV